MREPSEIAFWFDFGSNYSYLSAMRIGELADRHGVVVHWRPFLLGPIFRSFGWATSPFVLQKEKGEYVWRDMVRQASKHGIPWTRPTTFPRGAVLPARVAVAAAAVDAPWLADFVREVFILNFSADEEIDTPAAVSGVLARLGQQPDAWLAAAVTQENKERLRAQTERARALGIFGAPTFIVDGELFWGNDRLEDALDAARGAGIA
ncbi:MAG: 2-hydroxychromene-2-carboxylate isomerase [Lautropia sp.]